MVEVSSSIRKKNLWLKVREGDVSSIRRSGRFRDLITVFQKHELVGISKVLLTTGVFFGKWRCCQVQLSELEHLFPRLCIRFNGDNEWMIFSVGSDISVNDRPIRDAGFCLDFGDKIRVEQYLFEIVTKPMLKEELKAASAEIDMLLTPNNKDASPQVNTSRESTDFELRIS